MGSLTEIRAQMTESQESLLRAISGVTEQQFKQRPDEQTWCIAEVLAHLLYTERLWTGRVAAALAQDGAPVQASDPAEHETAAQAGRRAPVPQLIHGLLAARRELEKLLDDLEDADLARAIEHVARGHCTIEWMLTTYGAGHEREHVAQIEAVRAAIGVREPDASPAVRLPSPAPGSSS